MLTAADKNSSSLNEELTMIIHYPIHEVSEYINWIYFFHAWGFQPRFATIADIHGCDACRATWLASFPEEDRPKAAEAMQLFKEANRMLNELDADYHTHAVFLLAEANGDGDDLLLNGTRFPLLRQQTVKRKENEPFLCLSDFVRPLSSGQKDKVGAFATTVDAALEQLYAADDYRRMLVQTLSDRLAEATAEKLHEDVRRNFWGYAPDERLSVKELHYEKYQGIRPAVGYPSLPDQSVNFILEQLLDMKQIGITLTENGMMQPHASVSGLMFAHPAACYFSIGKIAQDQLADYAVRRGMSLEKAQKFLAANL